MTNISNMYLEMRLFTPPQLNVREEEGNTILLTPFCLPPKPEIKVNCLLDIFIIAQKPC